MANSFDEVLAALLKRAEETNSDALVVMHQGELLGAWRFGKSNRAIETMSVTKSIVSFAVGRLITKGLLSTVDEPVCTFYPEWKQGRKKNITVKHIMNHVSGLQNEMRADLEIYPSPDFVQLALCAELSHEPDTVTAYNNKAVSLLAGIVEKISGQKLDEFMLEEIFVPLRIEDFYWTKDKAGNPQVMAGLGLLPEDLAKLGQLFLNRGMWQGQPMIEAGWFDQIAACGGEFGLLWLLLRDVTVTVNKSHLQNVRANNSAAELVETFGKLEGTYQTGEFIPAFQKAFGESWHQVRQKLSGVNYRDVHFGNIKGYRAEGYLGQHLCIFPEQQLLAVRMIHYEHHKNDADNFADFPRLVTELSTVV
jgi:CubicO group peptidase (beta-lactamase class C family)